MRSIGQFWTYLEVEPSGFADRLDVNVTERSQRRLQGFWLDQVESWRHHQVSWGRLTRELVLGGRLGVHEISFGQIEIEMPIKHLREDV